MAGLDLGHGFAFGDLYSRDGLARLDATFLDHLKGVDAGLHDRLVAARGAPEGLGDKDESDLLIALGPHLEDFAGRAT
jgi:hypothetical protein